MTNDSQNGQDKIGRVVLTEEQEKSRRARNIAIALALGAFIVLFYVVTIVKLGGAAPHPPA